MTVPNSIRRRRQRRHAQGLVIALGVAALSGAAFLAGLSLGFEVGGGPLWTVVSRMDALSIQIPAPQDPAPGGRAVASLTANAGTRPAVTTAAAPDHLESATLPGRGGGEPAAPGRLFGGRT